MSHSSFCKNINVSCPYKAPAYFVLDFLPHLLMIAVEMSDSLLSASPLPLATKRRWNLGKIKNPSQDILYGDWYLNQVHLYIRGVTLTTHSHLVPRSWMNRSYTSSPQAPSWPVAEQLCSYIHISVSIVSDYGLGARGSIPGRGRWFFL